MSENKLKIEKLTALWALSESGLGGVLHALNIPFSGFFLAALSVIIISLIAHYAEGKVFRQIVAATIIVLIIKAILSPHTPLPAYFAVAFQGLLGAICFQMSKSYASAMFFGGISLLESAIQKILILTIFFGKSLWNATDLFIKDVLEKIFHLQENIAYSTWLIAAYCGGYLLWGVIVGFWSKSLPAGIEKRMKNMDWQSIQPDNGLTDLSTKRKFWMPIVAISILLITALILFFYESKESVIWLFLRTAIIVLLWYVLHKWVIIWLKRRLNQAAASRQVTITKTIERITDMRQYIAPAYTAAATKYQGIARFKEFVILLILLALKDND